MIKSLEGGRGIAALIVALYHLQVGTRNTLPLPSGYLFVDLFFVLSGFVICAAYGARMRDGDDFRSFMIRRTGRLLPLLLFSTIAFVTLSNLIAFAKEMALAHGFASALNSPQAVQYVIPTAKEIFATLSMTHSLGLFDRLILNTPSWSISTEFYTYLLFAAVCLLVTGRARLTLFAALSLTGLALSTWASVHVHHCMTQGDCLGLTYDFGFTRSMYSFFLGALVYHASRGNADFTRLQWPALGVLLVLLIAVGRVPLAALAFPLAFALLILSVCTDAGPLAAVLKLKPLQVLGERSYSIYLMHMPLLLVFENIAKRVDGYFGGSLVMLGYVTLLIVVSGWTFKYIEDPFRIAFNRIAAGYGAPAAALVKAKRTLD